MGVAPKQQLMADPAGCMVYLPRYLQDAIARALFAAGSPSNHLAFLRALEASAAKPLAREPAVRADRIVYQDPLWSPIGGQPLA